MEQIVQFQSGGKEIFGILHSPDLPMRQLRVGIIIAKHRIGPHRIYVQAARRWSKEGFHVLRMDFPGEGDSMGDYRYYHIDYYMDEFQIPALLDAIRYLKEREEVEKVVLFGLCTSARAVLYTAGVCPEVQHIILLSMPFSSTSIDSPETASFKKSEIVSSVRAKAILIKYLKILMQPHKWKKLLRGDDQFSFRFLVMLINSLLKRNRERLFHGRIYISMRTLFERQGHILFVYGNVDWVTKDFTEAFQLLRPTIQGIDLLSEIFIVESANHVFSRIEWKANVIEYITAWLNRQFSIERDKKDLLNYTIKKR